MTDRHPTESGEKREQSHSRAAQGDTDDGNAGIPELEQRRPEPQDHAEGTDELDTLKARTAEGSRGPEAQKGFGQGA